MYWRYCLTSGGRLGVCSGADGDVDASLRDYSGQQQQTNEGRGVGDHGGGSSSAVQWKNNRRAGKEEVRQAHDLGVEGTGMRSETIYAAMAWTSCAVDSEDFMCKFVGGNGI